MNKYLSASEYLDSLSNTLKSEFAFKKYIDKNRILFEILLDENSKLVTKITENDFEDMVNNKEISPSELSIFDSSMIVGNITIREIFYDAKPLITENNQVVISNKCNIRACCPIC